MTLVSIYATVYNNAYVIEESIRSLARSIPLFAERYEVVVVDNYSTDGTWEILLKLRREFPNIRVYRAKCSRGKGRDIALRLCRGDYVAYVDLDCVFGSSFGEYIDKLSRICVKGEVWIPHAFAKRETMIEQVGGWRDLNYGEDWELFARVVESGAVLKRLCAYVEVLNVRTHKNKAGERRYSSSIASYISRRIKSVVDCVRGWRIGPCYAIYELRTFGLSASRVALALASIFLGARRKCEDLAKCVVYRSETLILPEDLGLDRERLFAYWENISLSIRCAAKNISRLLAKAKDARAIILTDVDSIAVFRDPKYLKRAIRVRLLSAMKRSRARLLHANLGS